MYADVDGDNLPDMVHGRITARDAGELETMIGKMLDVRAGALHRSQLLRPPDHRRRLADRALVHPLHRGLLRPPGERPRQEPGPRVRHLLGHPGHGLVDRPPTPAIVVNYFGPSGLGYIPATPPAPDRLGRQRHPRQQRHQRGHLHAAAPRPRLRDRAGASPTTQTAHLAGLTNDMYPFVFTINCLTGKYNYARRVLHRALPPHGATGASV